MCALPFQRKLTPQDFAHAKDSVQPFSAAIAEARAQAGPGSLTVAWMSDIHLHAWRDYQGITQNPYDMYGTLVDCSAQFHLALTEVAALNPAPDLLIFGGDLADSGWNGQAPADEHLELKRILDAHLSPTLTTLPMLGNHDHADRDLDDTFHETWREVKRRNWPEPVESKDFYYTLVHNGWRLIVLDSRQDTPLTPIQHAWLAAQLAVADAPPTAILIHRPFVSVGNWVDYHRLMDRPTFDLIDHAASVKVILSGHTHKATAWRYHGKVHTVFPALAYGIGDRCGWGCAVLGKTQAHSIFVKELCARTFDHVAGREFLQEGRFRKLETPLFEDSEMCDPCTLPRTLPPKLRG